MLVCEADVDSSRPAAPGHPDPVGCERPIWAYGSDRRASHVRQGDHGAPARGLASCRPQPAALAERLGLRRLPRPRCGARGDERLGRSGHGRENAAGGARTGASSGAWYLAQHGRGRTRRGCGGRRRSRAHSGRARRQCNGIRQRAAPGDCGSSSSSPVQAACRPRPAGRRPACSDRSTARVRAAQDDLPALCADGTGQSPLPVPAAAGVRVPAAHTSHAGEHCAGFVCVCARTHVRRGAGIPHPLRLPRRATRLAMRPNAQRCWQCPGCTCRCAT